MIWMFETDGKFVVFRNSATTYTSPAPVPEVLGSTAMCDSNNVACLTLLFVKLASPTTGQQLGLLPCSCVPFGQAVGLSNVVDVVRATSANSEPNNVSEKKN